MKTIEKCKKCDGAGYVKNDKNKKSYNFALHECSFCEGRGSIYVAQAEKIETENDADVKVDDKKEKKRGRPSLA